MHDMDGERLRRTLQHGPDGTVAINDMMESTGRLDRLVPRIVLDWVIDEPDRQWRVVDGTMVFADISGFTALSEKLATRGRIGTEELVETLSRVFGGMLDITARRGGQLLKFGGDALLLLFTGPDHPRQAASAAIEMRRALKQASEIPTSVGKLKLKISIGAHSGSFHLFLVGDPYRQLVVGGPDTTVAMNRETAAEAGQIVVSPEMAALLGPGSTKPRDDGELMVAWRKGMVDPIEVPPPRPTDAEAARLVTPPIIASLLEHGAPDPVHRVATMAFFKFKGTDQRLEERGPDGLADDLHQTLAMALTAFEAEDIALLYVDVDANGGKLYCSSGVPLTSEDDEGRMLRAARSIIDADPPLPLQVGIHRGHVFAGELGAPDQAVFSIMGDTVNTAARIMVTAPPGAIHAHPAVLENARVRYDTEPQGPFTFKGKALPQIVYRVGEELGPREAVGGDELPFIGRGAERSTLRALIEAVEDGRGGVVTIVGATGLGKSRVLREALGADHPRLVDMHAEPYGASNSYRVVRDPLRALFGLKGTDTAELAKQLKRTVRTVTPGLEPFLPLMGDALQLPVPSTPESDAIAAEARADRTADVVLELLQTLHAEPLVFIADDMQWADDASAHLLGRVGVATESRPWLLFVLRRDETGGLDPEAGERITIHPLSDDEVRELAIAATEATPLRPHELDLVVDRASGSPMFVGELIAAAQELGSLDAVPASLQGTLAAQVDALDPLSKRMLSYASVLGRSFRRTIVDELLRREGLQLDEATITQLSRFLEADGPLRYRFKNGLVCDVVYDSLAYRARARLHLAAGEAFETLASGDETEVAMLSLHFSLSDDHERAYRYACAAAERAEQTHTISEAIAHYERALASARRVDVRDDDLRRLLMALGDARRRAGLFDAALDAYRRAAKAARNDVVAQARTNLFRARVHENAGSYTKALTETTRGRTIASAVGNEGHAVQAELLAYAASVQTRQSRSERARRTGLAAAQLAEQCGERTALASAYNSLFIAESHLGNDEEASAYARRAYELYEALGDLENQATVANNLGVIAYYRNEWDEALKWYGQAAERDHELGRVLSAGLSEANIGEVLLNQGRLDDAEAVLRRAVRVLQASNSAETPFAQIHLARLFTARKEFDAAEGLLRTVIERCRSIGSVSLAYEATLHLADCFVRSGRPVDALTELHRQHETPPEIAIFEAAECLVEASALVELGRSAEATGLVVRGVAAAREQWLTFDLARLLRLAARIGPPFDERLGTAEPAEEAQRLLDRLGVLPVERP
jgi:class 3 adenylate cyclase/tetratricopeptide (TPR) repeat protein